jgi:hypothetical protein
MPLNLAQKAAYNLALTLMVTVILFRTDSGYAIMIEAEFDGDAAQIVHAYDPWEIMRTPA